MHEEHKQRRKTALPLILILGVLAVLLLGGIYYFSRPGTDDGQVSKRAPLPHITEPTIPPAEPEPVPEPETRMPLEAEPVHLYIPALEVDAEIQATGADKNGTMLIVPSASIISWFSEAAIPGNEGNAFLAGHNKWRGKKGHLIDLDTLSVGDEMLIEYADGAKLRFLLESVFVYKLATAPADIIMYPGGEARVTVITCKEPFNPLTGTSDNRIVAIFKEESVFVIPDPPIEPFPAMHK